MLNKTKNFAALLVLSFATAASSHAAEVAVESLAIQMLSQSVANIQQQLSKDIQQKLRDDIQDSILTSAIRISKIKEETYATKKSSMEADGAGNSLKMAG